MEILVTNDDGVNAPGLKVLAKTLSSLGKVTVVAPETEMSGVSHALTVHAIPEWEHVEERTFYVRGTPADCVNLAVRKLMMRPPDLVVSGINRGANVADDVAYSGTVGAAREAAMLGVRAIAVSLAVRSEEPEYEPAAEFIEAIVPLVTEREHWGRRTFLNVNVPEGAIKGVRVTHQGRREPWASREDERKPAATRVYEWIQQGLTSGGKNGMSDIDALRAKYIAVTPLQFDFTNYHVLEDLTTWGLSYNGKR